jgi:hypothetical protein
MKNIALVAVLVLTLVSCKQKESTTVPQVDTPSVSKPAANPLCDELSQIQDEAEIDRWIAAHKTDLCDGTLYECVVKEHKLDFKTYYAYIDNAWPNGNPNFKTIKWQVIKDFIGDKCYPDYVGFKLDNQEQITDLKIVPFTKVEAVYSPALFRSIDKLTGGLGIDDEFTFVTGKIGTARKVIFSVEHISTGQTYFFDISDNPTFVVDYYKDKLKKK